MLLQFSQPLCTTLVIVKKEGQYLVNGVEVNPISRGVQNRHELDLLIERAAEESPPVLPTIEELNCLEPH